MRIMSIMTEPSTLAAVRARVDRIASNMLWCVEILVAVVYLVQRGGTAIGVAVDVALLVWAANSLRCGQWRPARESAVVGAYLLCTAWLVDGPAFTAAASPMLAVAGTAVVSFGMSRSARWSLPATVAVMGAWAVGATFVAGVERPWTIFSLDFLIVEWAAAAALRLLVLRSASLTDDAFAELATARIDTEVAEARSHAEMEQWATLHDTAASTLAMLGQGAVIAPDRLATQIRRDLRAVEHSASLLGPDDLAGQLHEHARWITTPVRFTGGAPDTVDQDVRKAVVAAAGEALTNVDRHARAQSVTVELGEGFVRIRDDGVGFDPHDATLLERRFGVRHSIQRRLTLVGATVEIHSAPGAGTSVDIRWPRDAVVPPSGGVDHVRGLLRGLGFGLVLLAVLVTGLQGHNALDAAHPVAQAAIVVVAFAAALLALVEIRVGLPTAVWWSTAAVVVTLGPVQVLLLDVGDLATGRNWAVAALGWQIAALSVSRRSRRGFALLGVLWVAGIVVTVTVSGTWAVMSSLVYTVISVTVVQAVAIGFSDFLRHAVARTEQINAEITDLQVRTELADALLQDQRHRYGRLSIGLVPLLNQLVEHPDTATDPKVRASCLLESVRLRRLFGTESTTDPFLEELAPAVTAAESRGVAVSVHVLGLIPDLDPVERTRALTVPIILLTGARTRAKLVITAEPSLTVSITCDCDEHLQRAAEAVAPEGTVVTSGSMVWATMLLS
ncbi:sensor histidine kinase [Nocardia sp. NPDC058519]|uniref:sensor histidine kinase n=1 Tax=Nocardia sp. NPDC058519 TaxID=3346535 RepID=UPI00365D5CC4